MQSNARLRKLYLNIISGSPSLSAYSASQFAVRGLTQSTGQSALPASVECSQGRPIALELSQYDITVNTYAPESSLWIPSFSFLFIISYVADDIPHLTEESILEETEVRFLLSTPFLSVIKHHCSQIVQLWHIKAILRPSQTSFRSLSLKMRNISLASTFPTSYRPCLSIL